MCLALYFATRSEQPLETSPYLSVEELRPEQAWVRQCFSLPVVRYIGTHVGGCSCAFQYIICDEPFEFYEGMFLYDQNDERDNLRITDALLARVRAYAEADGEVELFPQLDLPWLSEEPAPLGVVEKPVDGLEARTFFFVAQFLYRVRRSVDRSSGAHPAAGTSSIEK